MSILEEALRTMWLELRDVSQLASWVASAAMIFGGVVPYVPQYREIRRSRNAEGFSSFVCLALLLANTLRILFWFGHPFELPLLAQSLVMNVCMLAMLRLCVQTRNANLIVPLPSHTFTDHPLQHFWAWGDFLSYVEFLATFALSTGLVLYVFLDVKPLVEALGFLALLTEALLGLPQFYTNLSNKSTKGMSNQMVVLWTAGDVFKTAYFVARSAPMQFWLCGSLQVCLDLAILLQVVWYRRRLLKGAVHNS